MDQEERRTLEQRPQDPMGRDVSFSPTTALRLQAPCGQEGDFPTRRASRVLREMEKPALRAAGEAPEAGRQQATPGPWGLHPLTGLDAQSPGPCLPGGCEPPSLPAGPGSLLQRLLPSTEFEGRRGAAPAYLLSPAASGWDGKEAERLRRRKRESVFPSGPGR